MIKDNIIKKSFFISILFHFALLTPWGGIFNFKSDQSRPLSVEPVVVSYKISNQEKIEVKHVKFSKEPKKIKDKDLEREPSEDLKENVVVERETTEQDTYLIKEDEVVSLSGNIDSDIVPEVLIEYYSSIREEIKKKAFYYKPSEGRGAVTVIFGIDSKGLLKKLAIDDVRSTNRVNLRAAALKSIKHAAPFSPFPPELKNNIITFSITIEFALGSN